jgi:hypothetical protein
MRAVEEAHVATEAGRLLAESALDEHALAVDIVKRLAANPIRNGVRVRERRFGLSRGCGAPTIAMSSPPGGRAVTRVPMTFAMPLRLEPEQTAVDDDGVRCVVAFRIDGQASSENRECRDCDDDGHRRCGAWCVTAPLAMFEFGAGA